MAARTSRYAILVIAILVMSVFLPHFFWKALGESRRRTLIFYAPVAKRFIYKEMRIAHRFRYGDETGKRFDRQKFEEHLPFLYWKNLDKLGKLPILIDGVSYDEDVIKGGRQSVELLPRMFPDRHPQIQLYPLFNTRKDKAVLSYPDEMFRITDQELEFIIAKTKRIDKKLSQAFTAALKNAGFQFPARLIAGKTTSLKSFDEGYFIVDQQGAVFHLKRVENLPVCTKTPITTTSDIRHIRVSENYRKEFYGTLLTTAGRIYLISYDNYNLIPLPTTGYNPDTMSLKLLVDPIYRTITYSDEMTAYAVVTDQKYQPLARYQRPIPNPNHPLVKNAAALLFPFIIEPKPDINLNRYMTFSLHISSWPALIGIAISLLSYTAYLHLKKISCKDNFFDFILILCTGFYGLLAAIFITPEP
jgi:hypothetical protein